jgi:hypothetical protein
MDKNYISEISSVEKGLKGINAEIAKMEAGLKRISGVAGTTLGTVKSVLGGNLGQGNSLGLGTSSAVFGGGAGANTGMNASSATGSLMSWMYGAKGAATMAGVQLGLGAAGAAYAGLPDTGTVMNRATGFFNLAQRSGGMNRQGVAQATFSAMAGGVTGPNEDMAAASVLALGYNYSPGSASMQSLLAETRGAALAYNMPNATAAQALAGMHTGSMAGNLYAYGISTYDVKNNAPRTMGDITKQLYQRMVGNKKVSQQDIELSMTQGFGKQSLDALGFSQTQQELVTQGFINLSQGKPFELKNEQGGNNPLKRMYDVYTSQSALSDRAADPYIQGVGKAADLIIAFNDSISKLPDSIYAAKAALDTFASSTAGKASGTFLGGVGAAVGVGVAYKAAQKFFGKGTSAVANTVSSFGSKANTITNTLGKVGKVPVLGKLLGLGAIVSTAQSIGNPLDSVKAITGSKIPDPKQSFWDGVLSGTRYIDNPSRTVASNHKPMAGDINERQWATEFLGRINAPVTEQNMAAMLAWQRAEGGGGGKKTGLGVNSANYNPLNTTLDVRGAKRMGDGPGYGGYEAGVKSYNSWNQGMDATVKTIMNGKYTGILAALQQGGSSAAVLDQVVASPWGTKNISGTSGSSGGNVNINLNIDKASDAEAIAFAKRVKRELQKELGLLKVGSR